MRPRIDRKYRPRFFEVTLPFRRSPKFVKSRKVVIYFPQSSLFFNGIEMAAELLPRDAR